MVETEAIMDHSKPNASDSAFPVVFVVLSTFIGIVVWLFAMLNSLSQY
jgi:hypothetical protein